MMRCHLLTGMATFMGSFFFGIGIVFALTLGLECDPLGSFRLALWGRETDGVLNCVEATHYEENEERVYRFVYDFQLPDGTLHRGTSYWPGTSFDKKTRLAPAAAGMAITVQYDPISPRVSRIKGTRTGMCAHWVMFVFIFPFIGSWMLFAGLSSGCDRIRLMKWGELVSAKLTVCHSKSGDGNADVPVIEFKRQWIAQMEGAPRLLSRFAPIPLALRGFVGVWTLGVLGFVSFDVLFCLAGISSLLFNYPLPFHAPPEMQLIGTGLILAFLIVSLSLVSYMLNGMSPVEFLRRIWSNCEVSDDASPWPRLRRDIPNIDSAFEYPTPSGEIAQGRDTITLTGAPEEGLCQPALVDPNNSQRVMLVASLLPSIWVGPYGDWDTDVRLLALVRMTAVLILCVAGLLIGLTMRIVGL
jgi:hypothetical protein